MHIFEGRHPRPKRLERLAPEQALFAINADFCQTGNELLESEVLSTSKPWLIHGIPDPLLN